MAVDPVTRGAGLGKIRNHKKASLKEKRQKGQEVIHDVVWCPGSGEVVDIEASAVKAGAAENVLIPAQRVTDDQPALFPEPAR